MTKVYCRFCGKEITNKLTYYISTIRYGDTPLCRKCYQHTEDKIEFKEKYTPFTRWEIMDI